MSIDVHPSRKTECFVRLWQIDRHYLIGKVPSCLSNHSVQTLNQRIANLLTLQEKNMYAAACILPDVHPEKVEVMHVINQRVAHCTAYEEVHRESRTCY